MKIEINGIEILVKNIDIVDGFAVLQFGEYEIKIPLAEWEAVVNGVSN